MSKKVSVQAQTKKPEPMFLFGFERSGTTLLAMMVGAHPQIAVPFSVTGLWYRYGKQLDRYNQLNSAADVERIVDDLLAEERIALWDVELDRAEILEGLESRSYPLVVGRFHEVYARHCGKPHWASTDIATLFNMHHARQWFPSARFIHIVRDGRDVALSHRTMPFGAQNLGICADHWTRRVGTNLMMGAMISADQYFVVRYEDLVLHAEESLRRMCAFMGVEFSTQMLEYYKMVGRKVPEGKRWLWPLLDKPPEKSNAYRWKTRMSKLQRDVFERRGNALLSELGYEAYSEVPRSISAIFLEQWYTLNLAGNLNTLAARFGLRRRSQLERNWRRGKNKKRQAAKYQDAQREAFGSLVQRGVISNGFRHAAASVSFVQDTVNRALNGAPEGGGLSILDCGCGTGVWLEHLRDTRRDANPSTDRFFGFDLTPEMVELARQRLQPLVPAEHLQIGDVLRDDSYEFTSAGQKYDLIFAYDIVQQLPRRLQLQACRAMLEHLSSNGVLMVFDNDAQSYHGRVMGMKKLITRYLHINLVPRFYLNARYPALGRLARRLEAEGRYRSEIHVAPNGVKRALVVRARQSA